MVDSQALDRKLVNKMCLSIFNRCKTKENIFLVK
jgi:hypothetical protein